MKSKFGFTLTELIVENTKDFVKRLSINCRLLCSCRCVNILKFLLFRSSIAFNWKKIL